MAPPITCECGECSKCKHRLYMRDYYRRDPDRIRGIAIRSRERRIEKVRQYDRDRGFRVYDPQKVIARRMTQKLEKEPCEKCGDLPADAHHDDHSKPLEVRWLCRKCHGIEHRRF